jgi:hypothetical protein
MMPAHRIIDYGTDELRQLCHFCYPSCYPAKQLVPFCDYILLTL